MTIKLNSFYMVTFRSKAFRAIIGWRVAQLLQAQRKREERDIQVGGDIIELYELPEGYIK